MALIILDPTVAANVAAAVSQEAQRAALFAPFGSADVTVRALNGATLRETQTYEPWLFDSNTPRGATLGNLIARTVSSTGAPTSFVFRAGSTDVFSMTGAVSPGTADIVLAANIAVGPRTNLADGSVSKLTISTNPALPVTSAVATAFTLSLSASSGFNGVAVTVTVTPNGPIQTGGASVTLAASNGGTLGTTSLSFTSGSTAAQSTTLTRSTAGTSVVTMTNNIGLANTGSPASYTSIDGLAWSISDAGALNTGRNTTTTLATGVPSGSTFYASPDLLPGQTLALDGETLNLVGDATVPTVNGDDVGSPIDTISARDTVIEVMDNPIATIRNATKNITYEYAPPGSWPQYDSQTSNRWNAVWGQMSPGDVIEISPGAVQAEANDASHYYSNSLDSCGLHIAKSGTFKNMTGRGRWRVWPASVTPTSNRNGIGIFSPSETGLGRGTFIIEGFDLTDQFLTSAAGVRIRSSSGPGTWLGHHAALTLRNFKIGRTTGRSLSGVSGTTELMTLEDGHVFDCGDGSGQEHNVYIGARVLTMRGMRFNRTRGWVGTPWGGGSVNVEGHILKVSAVTGILEGCAIDCAALGDQSLLLQMKAGGNWTVRGNVFKDSQAPNNANGAILMCREYATDGVTQNFEWWAGSEGNSLLFEKNVYIGHYPRPPIFFYSQASVSAMRPATGGAWTAAERLDSLTVRDNIAMVATVEPYGAWMLSGFPGTDNAMWINQDPNAGADWAARGNTVMTYGTDEPGFSADENSLLLYRREAGTIAASGSVATKRFVWPHGSIDRTDAFRGLA